MRFTRGAFPFALAVLSLTVAQLPAQTFRGEMKGTVEDASGAAVPETLIRAVNIATGFSRSALTSNTGDYSIPDLPLGAYKVTATKQGFQEQVAESVEIVVSRVTGLNFKLNVAQQASIVEVNASAAVIETASTALTGVVNTKTIEDLPMNGRDFRQMLKLNPGVGAGTSPAINGSRTRGNNFQIDGADNNDGFQNVAAVNQGGVSGIAGTLLPVEAIDQFSLQSNGSAEVGRNGGGVVNLVIKSGTNELHGSAYYFNRNEAFASPSPFQPVGASARRVRNNQGGFSIGGPIVRNKLFYFATGEFQEAEAANSQAATTPSPAWIARGETILRQFNVPVNSVSRNLLAFWPERTRTGAAVANNYLSLDANTYDSYNGIIKVDYNLNDKHTIAARYYGGTGAQTALVNSNAPFKEYFQVAPSRMHNYSVVMNSVLTPRLVNQVVLGANYFKQTFNDFDTSPNPIAAGLNTGVTEDSLRGAPFLRITGFADVGATQPLGRIDTTGHITDTASLTLGKHQIKFGGEYRRAVLDIFYDQNKRGTFNFDGTAGPWAGNSAFTAAERALADFLGGFVRASNGATIVRGPLQRDYRQNSWDLFFHDTWQVTPRLTLNYGLRYSYLGPLFDLDNAITTFIPGRGIVGKGAGLDSLYPSDWNNLAPRFGFAFQPVRGGKTVIRGAYGVFFDVPAVAFFASNSGGNGGAQGVNGNPGGNVPVFNVQRDGFTLVSGEPVFGSANPRPPFGVLSVNQDFATPYVQNFNLNIQREMWRNGVLQVGYVGSLGRKLVLTRNINQPRPGVGSIQSRRPFALQHPELSVINQLESISNSNYNAMQVQFTQSLVKGFTAQFAYTWSKAIDLASEARNRIPADSFNLALERGPADFDIRHNLSAFFSYQVPVLGKRMPRWLTDGWQLNTLITAHTGQPFDLRSGTDRSGTGDQTDRVDLIGDPYADVSPTGVRSSRRWFNPAAFRAAAPGTFGTLGRNALYGPGFATFDPSVFKTTRIREKLSVQFRVEMFNVFNRENLAAAPGTSLASSTAFGLITNTRNGGSAPGLGFGEPRNLQFAVKLLW